MLENIQVAGGYTFFVFYFNLQLTRFVDTILHRGGGVYRDPQNALRNLWTAPNAETIFIRLNQLLITGWRVWTRRDGLPGF